MLRKGIISSVFPFASPFPHGFTIDAMVQPGASGSPIFLEDQPIVVGMVESFLPDRQRIEIVTNQPVLSAFAEIPLSTNISVALPGHLIVEGKFPLKQSDFGITPFSALGGAMAVADQVDIEFRLVLRPPLTAF